jgi:plasmid replication initiation protein
MINSIAMENINDNQYKEVTLWQSNAITKARYEMSALEKNILYMVMSQIKKGDKTNIYQVSANEIMQKVGKELRYDDLREATRKLITRYFEAILPNGNLLQGTFVATAEYLTGKGVIEIELSEKIKPFYVELKEHFTTFQLDVALSLNGIYAKRLYEILSMYKNMDNKSFIITLTELKSLLGVFDPKTKKDKYKNFADFKKYVLGAGSVINEKTDISFTYREIKLGRKVEKIEFMVKYVKPVKEKNQVEERIFTRLTNDFKLRKDQANVIISKHSTEEINKMLYEINIQKTDGKIKNVGAYTAKVFGID